MPMEHNNDPHSMITLKVQEWQYTFIVTNRYLIELAYMTYTHVNTIHKHMKQTIYEHTYESTHVHNNAYICVLVHFFDL